MTVYEKLMEEFGAAITAVLGDQADKEMDEVELDVLDIEAIAKKVAFYLDLN